jgi:hypothetical protein
MMKRLLQARANGSLSAEMKILLRRPFEDIDMDLVFPLQPPCTYKRTPFATPSALFSRFSSTFVLVLVRSERLEPG